MAGAKGIYGYLTILGLRSLHPSGCLMTGNVSVFGTLYSVVPAGPGRVRIEERLPQTENSDDVVYEVSGVRDQAREINETRVERGAEEAPGDETGNLALIDTLVVYPWSVLPKLIGGAREIEAAIGLATNMVNDAFRRSRIPARVNIVAVQGASLVNDTDLTQLMMEVVGRPTVEALYQEAVAPRPESKAIVEALREEYQADVVVLVVPRITTSVAGQAGVIPEPPRPETNDLMHSILAIALDAIPGNTFAHELGHLLGAKHDRFTQPRRLGGEPMYDYVRGYSTGPGNKLVTIMGYPGSGGERIPLFSSADPDIQWNGQPVGIPISEPNSADASAFLRRSVYAVANYRGTATDQQSFYTLELNVFPPEAGTVLPDALGPYLKDSVVRVGKSHSTGRGVPVCPLEPGASLSRI